MMGSQRDLKISPPARREVQHQLEYLEGEASAEAADSFYLAVSHTLELLQSSPGIGRKSTLRSRPGVALFQVNVSSPFKKWIVFYTVAPNVVIIERVLNGARDLKRLLL